MRMNPLIATCLTAAGLLATAATSAADAGTDMPELAKASGCFSCHSPTEKVVGPAFSSVAEKYAGQKDAAADLAMSIRNGSSGKWGRVPMPGHGNLPPEDVKRLAAWVLTVRK